MQRFPAADLKNVYSPFHEPHGRVRSGETFQVETEDCFSGRLRDPENFTAETLAWVEKNLDVVTGPIYVEGVRAGDAVAVRIEAFDITTPGTLYLGRFSDPSPDDWWLELEGSAPVVVEDGFVVVNERLRVPVKPILGCLATAPEQEVILSRHEGEYGGNQDCGLMTTGATVILPAQVDGALLYFGDCKARMGDGEIVSPPEVGAFLTVTATRRPRPRSMTWPRIETDSHLATVVSDIALADACRRAFRELMLWIEEDTGVSRQEIATLMGMVADTAVCQVTNRLHTGRCSVERAFVAQL